MSSSSGPSVVTDSLVFAYDMQNNYKSWMGKSTTNVIADAGKNCSIEYSGTSYPFVSQNITTQVQAAWAAGKTKFSMSFEGKRDYSVGGTGGGNDGYPSMYIYFTDWSWASSHGISTYDWSYNHWDNATLPDPTGKSVYFAIYHMNSGNPGKSYARNFQIEFESGTSYATPFVNGTRSNTQSILDLTGNNTITANSLTYNSDGSFSFNGSSNYAVFPENSSLNVQNPTVEVWVKTNALSQNGFWFEKGTVNTQYSFFQEGSNIQWRTHNGTSYNTQSISSSNIDTTNWWHMVATIRDGYKRIYVNGIEKSTVAWSSTIPTNANGCSIGVYGGYNGGRGYYFNGSIGSVKVYNRALTADEIQQNFNALRGRYGI